MLRILNSVLFSFAACLVLAEVPAAAWEDEALSAFHDRRAKLPRETGGDGVIVMFGYGDAEVASSTTMFLQDETFYYLTGWNEPGALILVVPKAAKAGMYLGRRGAKGLHEIAYDYINTHGKDLKGQPLG